MSISAQQVKELRERTGLGMMECKAALTEAIGEHGVVYPNAGDYRTAVRQALFPGLTEPRYDALITALLVLAVVAWRRVRTVAMTAAETR